MRYQYLHIVFLLLLSSVAVKGQEETVSTIVDWRQHNLNKYNRMLVNPAYSIVREDSRAISFWSRIQWTGVNNSPQTFLINYSGKIGESSGAGLGLYQQSLGLLTDSGMLMNYAHSIRFTEKIRLTLGVNSVLFRRGLNKNAVNSAEPDPAILENQDDFLWVFMPGINFSYGGLDLGVYAENLFDYNLNESRSVTGFEDKIYSAQAVYTHVFKNASGLLGGAQWRTMSYAKTQSNDQTQYGGNMLLDLPKYGWLQMGYNNVYGINGALGVKLGDGISVGVIFESGTNLSNRNFGPTYEAMATVELGSGKPRNTHRQRMAKATAEDGTDKNTVVTASRKEEPAAVKKDTTLVRQVSGERVYTVYAGKPKQPGKTLKERSPAKEREFSTGEEVANKEEKGSEENLDRIVEEVLKDAYILEKGETLAGKDDIPRPIAPVMISAPALTSGGPDLRKEPEVLYSDELPELSTEPLEVRLQPAEGFAEFGEDAVVTEKVFGETSSYRTLRSAVGVDKGFYLVVNVFSREHYFRDFTGALREQGFEPKYFRNPENNYWYVYLAYADNYYRVKQLQRSHFQGQYHKDKWVLWVK